MTIAVFAATVKLGGHGLVVGLSGAGIRRATGWQPTQPLNGQRCLTRAAFEAARPLARGWGVETGLSIDLLRKGMRVTEVEVELAHRATGTGLRAQLHRAHQLTDVARALAARSRGSGMMWAMPVAYLGPEGTFSEAALRALDTGAEPLPCPTIQAALAAVRDGTAERAVVPIESSVEGVVTATLDDLAGGNDLVIVAELQIPVAFALLARAGTAVGDIKRVGGHPQAMPQCRGWLGGQPARRGMGRGRVQRRGGPPGRGGATRRGAGGRLRRRPVRSRGSRGRRARPAQRRHPVRGGGGNRPAPGAHRDGPDLRGRVPDRGSPRRAARDPHRVRGARHQPDHDPVPPNRRPARPVLLLGRLRGPRGRRAGRRGADGLAPGLRATYASSAATPGATAAPPGSGRAPPTPTSPRQPPGWADCASAALRVGEREKHGG